MTFKELVRNALYAEMEDITSFGEEAELFGGDPRAEGLKELFGNLAEEKKARLKELGRVFKEGTGFRQRAAAPAKSLEAALRAHVARSEKSLRVYEELQKHFNKPEYKEAMAACLLREKAILAEIRGLQARLKSA